MDCQGCNRLLQAYLDGDLDGAPHREVEAHLDKCPDCRADYDRLVKVRDLLKDLREVEVPSGEREEFIRALMDRIEAERVAGWSRRINWRPALIGAIAVVAILIVLVSIPRQREIPEIAGAPGLNALENVRIDTLIMGGLDAHFMATSGDFLCDPGTAGGTILSVRQVLKETYGELFMPTEALEGD